MPRPGRGGYKKTDMEMEERMVDGSPVRAYENNSNNCSWVWTFITLLLLVLAVAGAWAAFGVSVANLNSASACSAATSASTTNTVSIESMVAPPNPPPCTGSKTRSYDGTCTGDLLNPLYGSVATATLELVEGGTFVPLESGTAPNERVLSNLFFKGPEEIENQANVSLWFTFWSEIIDTHTHDPITATYSGATQAQLIATGNPIAVFDYQCLKLISTFGAGILDPTDQFSPVVNPNITIPYLFSCDAKHPGTELCAQKRCFCTKSDHTPWLDMDNTVYPNDPALLAASRTLAGDGKLKTSTLSSGEKIPPTWGQTGRTFPFNGLALFAPLPDPLTTVDTAGTLGAASLNVLTTVSVLYREHNRLATLFKTQNPTWTDDQLFERARAWNIAQFQAIWAYEWLPRALGPLYEPLFGRNAYQGHRPEDFRIPAAFDSAIRSVHSTLYEDLDIVQPGPVIVAEVPAFIAVANASGNVDLLNSPLFGGSTAPIARSWIIQPANALDSIYVEFLRSLLPPGSPAPALDLAASDIRRGRMDHVSNYYDARRYWRLDDLYGKPGCPIPTSPTTTDPLACFLLISSNPVVAATLQQVYGSLRRVDLHVGAMVEDRLSGVFLPPTYAYIVGKTFSKLRSGDLYWFENKDPRVRQFTNAEITSIKNTRLIDLLNRNTPLTCPLSAGVSDSFSVDPEYPC